MLKKLTKYRFYTERLYITKNNLFQGHFKDMLKEAACREGYLYSTYIAPTV